MVMEACELYPKPWNIALPLNKLEDIFQSTACQISSISGLQNLCSDLVQIQIQNLWSDLSILLLNFTGTYVFPSVQLWAFPNTVTTIHISLVENGNKRVNSCVNFSPLLVVRRRVLKNPTFGNSFSFALEYARFYEICKMASKTWKTIKRKSQESCEAESYKQAFTWTW